MLVIALALTAFGGNSRQLESLAVANPAAGLQTKPFPQVLAMHGVIRLQMPVAQNQFTAIGFHSATDGAIPLAPIGHQGNEGVVQRFFHKVFGGGGGSQVWYRLDGGSPSALDVGAVPGTNVYAPVDGTVVGITPYIVGGHRFGTRIDIQPQSAPSLVVSLTQLRADPSLKLGSNVVSGRDASRHRRQPRDRGATGARAVHERPGQPRLDRDPPRSVAGPELRVLFLADVFGVAGRRAVEERLPRSARRSTPTSAS